MTPSVIAACHAWPGVGKTSIMHRYADSTFSPSLISTAGYVREASGVWWFQEAGAVRVVGVGVTRNGGGGGLTFVGVPPVRLAPVHHCRCCSVDYKTKYLNVNGKTVKCQIWDTAGQQRFHVITQGGSLDSACLTGRGVGWCRTHGLAPLGPLSALFVSLTLLWVVSGTSWVACGGGRGGCRRLSA